MKVTEKHLKKLDAYFPEDELEWRVMNQGTNDDRNTGEKKPWALVFVYITSRGLQDRLDEAVGRENWQNEFKEINGGFMCGISIKIEGEWITKWDGADTTDIEKIKGGMSGAEKRAGVQWGISRYLYDKAFKDSFAKFCNYGEHKYTTKIDGQKYYWNPPPIPPAFRAKKDTTKDTSQKEIDEIFAGEVKRLADTVDNIKEEKQDAKDETDLDIQVKIGVLLTDMFGDDKAKLEGQLFEFSTYEKKNKDTGEKEIVYGKKHLKDLKGKWLKTTYGKIKRAHEKRG